MDSNYGQNFQQPNMQQDPQYTQYLQYQEQQNNKKANILCTVSLILGLLGAIVFPLVYAQMDPWFSTDPSASTFESELIATANLLPIVLIVLFTLTGFVLMVIARTKYPRNVFAKILMWLYIVGIIIYVIMVIAVVVAFFWLLSQCIPFIL